MKRTSLALAFILCIAGIFALFPTSAAAEAPQEGAYAIRSMSGLYLTSLKGSLGGSKKDNGFVWHLRNAENGAFYVYAGDILKNELLDLNNDWDSEGNTVGIFPYTGYIMAQTWLFVPNDDGTYQIRTVHASGRALTENGAQQPEIRRYMDSDTQKWQLTPKRAKQNYTLFMNTVIGTKQQDIITHLAKNETDATLRKLLAGNANKYHMVESEHVVLHLPNDIWKKYKEPKKLVDAYDAIYQAQLELIGSEAKIYGGKLYFLTDHNPDAPYMYMSGDYCASSLDAVKNNVNYWNKGKIVDALWGVGHEIGHAMVNKGMGALFEAYDGESWCNVLNVYALGQLGLYQEARQWVAQYTSQYYGDDNKYGRYEGRDYDTLDDGERSADILSRNTHIFVKLPMQLVDHYGWEGMRAFFTKAVQEYGSGTAQARTSRTGLITWLSTSARHTM